VTAPGDEGLPLFARLEAKRAEAETRDAAEAAPGSRDAPWSVSQVVRRASRVLEDALGVLWIEGEVTSLSRPASGHLYFALKDGRSDARAELRAVMWRSDARRLRFALEDGQSLRCRGKLGIYQQGGKFQFYVQHAEPAGLGADALALEQLRRALAAEGLFDASRKRELPHLPRRIGVVTSKTGAAIRDVVRAVQRRFPVPILVADTRVQGDAAPAQIAAAVAEIGHTDVDVVIIARGGGSASDLAAYNDERVVRAVAACPIPTISAVGHEVDVSLTDLVADQRAATPTMAGEMAVPVLADLAEALAAEERRLDREIALQIRSTRQELDRWLQAADHRLHVAVARRRDLLGGLRRRLGDNHPRAQLVALRGQIRELEGRATSTIRRRLDLGHRGFAALAGRLEAMSPLRVLERGYALATTAEGHVLCAAEEVAEGALIDVKLARGELGCRVESVRPNARRRSDDDGNQGRA
jgi:exodeoxyribonuclease VII large subunit